MRERSSDPTTSPRRAWLTLTPLVRPNCTAKSAVFSTPTSTPPRFTNVSRLATPCHPSPGRRSSVCAQVPMFGVSGVFFHGSGFLHCGSPCTIACTLPPAGGNRMTSYFAFSDAFLATSCVLM